MVEEEDMRPAFYKIIHHTLNTTQNLRLPHDFLEHTVKDKTEKVILKGPTGSYQCVKVSKTADDTFLQDGWQEFVSDHSLGNYEFLVFSYNGDMHFDVQIFDTTGTEIQYGFEEPDNSSDGEKLYEPPKKLFKTVGKRRGRPPKNFVIPSIHRRGRGRPPKLAGSIPQCQTKAWTSTHGTYSQMGRSLQGRRLSTEQTTAKAWNAAMSFTSDCPYFISCLTESNLLWRLVRLSV